MSEQEDNLSRLWRKFEFASQMQVRWGSRNPWTKVHTLSEVWDELKEIGVHSGDDVYGEVEGLRLRILKEMSTLNGTLFKELRQEFRDDIISYHAEASLLATRISSFPSRCFEWLYEWQKRHDENRLAH